MFLTLPKRSWGVAKQRSRLVRTLWRMSRYCFGEHEFDSATVELRRNGVSVPLRPKASRALGLLLERADRLVTHEDLRHELWGPTIVEWETGIHQVIRQLRRVLGDSSRSPAFIETVPHRGYRFKMRVEVAGEARLPVAARRSSYRDLAFFLFGVLGLPLLVVAFCVLAAV